MERCPTAQRAITKAATGLASHHISKRRARRKRQQSVGVLLSLIHSVSSHHLPRSMSSPQLRDITISDWLAYIRAIRAYSLGLPEWARKFYLVTGCFDSRLTTQQDIRFQDQDWTSFEVLVNILTNRLFNCCRKPGASLKSQDNTYDVPQTLQAPPPTSLPLPPSSWTETPPLGPMIQPYSVWLESVERREQKARKTGGDGPNSRHCPRTRRKKKLANHDCPQKWSRAERCALEWEFVRKKIKLDIPEVELSNLSVEDNDKKPWNNSN